MIPATPDDNEVYNLDQMIRWKRIDAETCTVTFSDGVTRVFTGQQAAIINAEIVFAVNQYRRFVKATQEAINGGPLVIPADMTGGRAN